MFCLVLLVSAMLLCAVFVMMVWKDIPSGSLTRDPSTVFDGQLYIGFLSQIGIFFWAAAASICLFSAQVAFFKSTDSETPKFFLYSGLLSLLLGFDDVFLLHEHFFPFLGIPEHAVYVGYAGCMLLYVFRFHLMILRTEFLLFGAGLFCFALSMAIDWLEPEGIDIFLVEDGAKLIGILSWMAYFWHTCHSYILGYAITHTAVSPVRAAPVPGEKFPCEAKALP